MIVITQLAMAIKRTVSVTFFVAICVIFIAAQTELQKNDARRASSKTGVLLLAHGGKQNWNEEVKKIAAMVNQTYPVEVAFGMASKRNIQSAIDKLVKRNVTEIVAVPLFISSHSSVITSTEYLLGHRNAAPPELARFAKMDHGHGSNSHGSSSHGADHDADKSFDPTTPVKSPLPIKMLGALNSHPLVAEILLTRALSISSKPKNEVVIIVAHGPVLDEENAKWLADLKILAKHVDSESGFKRVEYLTVRDDAPEPIRSNATAELRELVRRAADEKANVLIVPLLLSYGGIEEGIKKRLEGLSYKMSPQALLPDERLATWVVQEVASSTNN